jgi:hypothetical protein
MATNPIPPQRGDKNDHARMTLVRGTQRRGWWPLLILLVAAALLIAIVALMPRGQRRMTPPPSAAEVPPQPTGNQVQLSDLKLVAPTPNGSGRLTGTVFNAGTTGISSIMAQAAFMGSDGRVAGQVTGPLLGLTTNGTSQPFLDNPIKPSERRAFAMDINQVPQGWNNGLPAITLTQVATQGATTR